MRILLTNDDGIMAQGIRTMARCLSKEHEVIVVAPEVERSATGHAITIRTPLWAKEVRLGKEEIGYAINGTPADCVKLGLLAMTNEKIDLVISGINRGPNLGTDVLYSGTVSGALEGAVTGIPSIAISSENYNEPYFETAANFMIEFLRRFDIKQIPELTALNINVPSVPLHEIKGWKVTRQSRRRYKSDFERRKDPYGNDYYWLIGEYIEDDPGNDSDYAAVSGNCVSITPIYVLMQNNDYMEELRKRIEEVS
ncbi:MAG: 5'/3'-nucleotidase SurE [Petrotogales bacterium]